jgi:hypothetical protein
MGSGSALLPEWWLGTPLPINLRKVFKVGTLSPDLAAGKSKKSCKMGLAAAKYS